MQFETNIFGMQELPNLIIPVLKTGYGRIINVSSLAGRIFVPYAGAYCASKIALEALFDALRMELEGTNFCFLNRSRPGNKQTNFKQECC
jgi:short-subunit dehydrogenase